MFPQKRNGHELQANGIPVKLRSAPTPPDPADVHFSPQAFSPQPHSCVAFHSLSPAPPSLDSPACTAHRPLSLPATGSESAAHNSSTIQTPETAAAVS